MGEESPDDRELLARAREGDRDAFSRLAAQNREALFRAAYHVLGNEADALDATQEALLRAYRHLATFDGRSSFRTWSRRIATNCALNRIERRKHDLARGHELPEGDALADGREPSSADLAREEERALVRRAIAELPPAQRAAVLLRDVEGLSYEEIARTLGIAKGTVMSRIYYGRENLKERLGRLLGDARRPG
ncbi:RNA polymerase sigma factor [bacterium]|nr:RNA polymerase sigma factor [bacterium]